MKTLRQLDQVYTKSIEKTYESLLLSYNEILSNYKFDLSTREISDAILNRMRAYYSTQNKIKRHLDKRYLAAASDFFVESTLFFLKLYFLGQAEKIGVSSERQIKKKRNAIRPDISIWKDEKVIAIIECKTQLGWNRYNWEKQYIERDKKLRIDFPNAKSFLLVMTGLNWSGFGENSKLNDIYFCLLDAIWPTDYTEESQIMTPIEGLIRRIREML